MTNAIERAKELLATKTHNWLRLDADLTECQEVLDIVSDLVDELEKANKVVDAAKLVRRENPNVYGSTNQENASKALTCLYEALSSYRGDK